MHLSDIFPLFDLQKRNERGSLHESDQWPGMTSQINTLLELHQLYP